MWVDVDGAAGACLATEHLLEQGLDERLLAVEVDLADQRGEVGGGEHRRELVERLLLGFGGARDALLEGRTVVFHAWKFHLIIAKQRRE